jgi:hypothetical protein
MVKMSGLGGTACARCEHKNAAADGYCAQCGLLQGAPRNPPVLVDNRWMPGPDELAVFFGLKALSGIFVKTLRVPMSARAYILQGGQATEVPQGEYEIEGFFTRLNHLLRDGHAEILVTRSSAMPLDFTLDGLATAEHLDVAARLALSVRIENVPAFARHFMTIPGTIGAAQLRELLQAPVRQLAAEFVAARSLRDMAGGANVRPELDQHLQGGLAMLLAGYGLAVVRVDTLALRHDKFDAGHERVGSLGLGGAAPHGAGDAGKVDDLYSDEEWQRIRREEEAARLAFRRAELRQEDSLERAALSLKNAERAHALRSREIELYGRIVESRTRKQAIERGAVDAVKDLEHALAGKRGARQDEAGQWEHLRALAGIRLRTELEVARQEAAEARTVAQQRFTHQLLQQQIRNKIEQAQGIEDAARRRSELARLHDAEQAAAKRAREIDDEEHTAQYKLVQLANLARQRGAERVLEWEESEFGARLRGAERGESVEAEEARQRIEALRRGGGQADALAQHEKLLRTIEADALQMRRAGELKAAEREAAWQHELRRMAQESERAAALGAMDDTAKLVLAPDANAALLADVMKTRLHAGMSPEQLAALAGVVGAANAPGVEAVALAQRQVEQERDRREREIDKDRRHQLDLLTLQNDVNKAALASQAQVQRGAGVVSAPSACTHAHAGRDDRYCGACGAPLPARG